LEALRATAAGGGTLPKRSHCPVLYPHITLLLISNDNFNNEGQTDKDIINLNALPKRGFPAAKGKTRILLLKQSVRDPTRGGGRLKGL
jgi:hypothetical protein